MPHLKIHAAFTLLALAAQFAGVSHAEDSDWMARFQLFNLCHPMSVVVDLSENASDIGLTKVALQSALESRLRAARLYADEVSDYLYLNVGVLNRAFSFSLQYRRWVCLEATGECGHAATWFEGATGTTGPHSGPAEFIRSSVSG